MANATSRPSGVSATDLLGNAFAHRLDLARIDAKPEDSRRVVAFEQPKVLPRAGRQSRRRPLDDAGHRLLAYSVEDLIYPLEDSGEIFVRVLPDHMPRHNRPH
jgi:hypothetical protein